MTKTEPTESTRKKTTLWQKLVGRETNWRNGVSGNELEAYSFHSGCDGWDVLELPLTHEEIERELKRTIGKIGYSVWNAIGNLTIGDRHVIGHLLYHSWRRDHKRRFLVALRLQKVSGLMPRTSRMRRDCWKNVCVFFQISTSKCDFLHSEHPWPSYGPQIRSQINSARRWPGFCDQAPSIFSQTSSVSAQHFDDTSILQEPNASLGTNNPTVLLRRKNSTPNPIPCARSFKQRDKLKTMRVRKSYSSSDKKHDSEATDWAKDSEDEENLDVVDQYLAKWTTFFSPVDGSAGDPEP